MIESISERIAISIKNMNEDTASIAVMKYSLIIILNTFMTIILCLLIGILLGTLQDTIIVMFTIAIFRFFSGGYHFRTATGCVIVSTVIIVTIPFISIPGNISLYLTLASLLLTIIYAPSNIKHVARMPQKYFQILKLISVLLVCLNFFISSQLIAVSFFIQGISLITWKGDEVYEKSS